MEVLLFRTSLRQWHRLDGEMKDLLPKLVQIASEEGQRERAARKSVELSEIFSDDSEDHDTSDDEVDIQEVKGETMNDKRADGLCNSGIQGRASYASDNSANDDIEKRSADNQGEGDIEKDDSIDDEKSKDHTEVVEVESMNDIL